MNYNYKYPNKVIIPYQYNNDYYHDNNFRSENGLELYNYEEGYKLGNMFKSLYDDYKSIIPTIKVNSERERELNEIGALTFAAHDLDLYLDVNPNNREAINLYYKFRSLGDEKAKAYESNYGPINLTSNAINKYPWSWIKSPWPWEGNL